jgi:hypothetical protein
VLLFSCLSAFLFTASAVSSATQQAWVFKRNNGLGPETIYATNDAVLITYPTAGLNVLCKKPAWEIVWFNTKNHMWYHESVTHYRTRKHMPVTEKQLPQPGRRATTYAGHEVIEFSTPFTDAQDDPFTPTNAKMRPIATQYFFSKSLSISKEATIFLDSYFGVPASGGVPLGAQILYSDKTIQRLWTTTAFEKSAVDPSLFRQPSGYKLLANADELGNAKVYTIQMEDMMNDLGVGKPFGH